MKWVEGITVPEVWTSKGPLKVNEIMELGDEEADYLIGRDQVIETSSPVADAPKKRGRPKGSKNKPKADKPEAKEDE